MSKKLEKLTEAVEDLQKAVLVIQEQQARLAKILLASEEDAQLKRDIADERAIVIQ